MHFFPSIPLSWHALIHLSKAFESCWAVLALSGLVVIERRGRSKRLDPKRQIEIATLLESMPEAVLLFDNERRVIEVNHLAEQFTGLDRNRLRSMDDQSLDRHLRTQDETSSPVDASSSVVTAALQGHVVRQVRRIYRPAADGRQIEALVSASPMREESNGATIGALVMVRDITEMVQLQHRLADTQRHNAIGQMAAGIAHDFNNVLDTIGQAVYLLESYGDREVVERKTYAEVIKNAVRRGAEISERVREYLRTGTGEKTLVDLRQLMDDVLEMTRPMWQLARKVSVRTHFGPVSKVCANAADIRRVFTNLIINALEAMPNGGVLTLGCEEIKNTVRVTVADTGQGIDPEQQKKMFVPYFTTKKSGTGIGLSSAQKIITGSGGTITFRTQPGKGTCFVIEMPTAERQRNPRKNHDHPDDQAS
jgi:PAS domain S-box-containing protein